MNIPDKCYDCNHTIIQLEQVSDGWNKYYMDTVVRCDCFPAHYRVGCVCADIYCQNKLQKGEEE